MFVLLVLPNTSFAAIINLNGLNDNTQFLSTTSDSTSMHMKIPTSGTNTHLFQWDGVPWSVSQGGTGTTTFTNGSVFFYNNGFSQNNPNFFWDFINNALSIGTNSTSTLAKFTVKGSSGLSLLNILSTGGVSKLFVSESGNVGVNNSSPQHALDVSGAIYSRLASTDSSVDWNDGNVQSITLTSNPTLTFSNGQAGGEYKLIVNQDGTGGRTITWPASVKWPGGNEPTLTATANGKDLINFVYDGSDYLGFYNLNYINESLAGSLVSYWKLDESSGNADDSVSSNDLTNNGSITYASAKINNGADLELSSSNYFSIADASQSGLDITSDLSISLWVKLESQPGTDDCVALVSKYMNTGNQRSYVLDYCDVSGTTRLQSNISPDGSNSDVYAYNVTLNNSTWYHVVFTWDASGAQGKFYLNSSNVSSPTGTYTSIYNGTADLNIGAYFNGSIGWLDGFVDEVGVWSRVLNSSEVSQLYNSGNGFQYPF